MEMRGMIHLGRRGVSEIVGTVLLLAIAVTAFSLLAVYVYSNTSPSAAPAKLNLAAYVNENQHIIVEHKGGETLDLDNIKIVISKGLIDDGRRTCRFHAGEPTLGHTQFSHVKEDKYWDIGEYLDIDAPIVFGGITGWQIEMIIVDEVSNSIILSGVLQSGVTDYIFTDNASISGAANFTWQPNPACTQNTIQFTDTSIHREHIISWNWSFDDGSWSDQQHPSHHYAAPNTYTVTLNVSYDPALVAEGVRNWDTQSYNVYVSDIPTIIDNSPPTAYTGDSYTFSADVSDSNGISTVHVEYWFGGGSHTNVSMSHTGGNTWETTITVPSDSLDSLRYIFSANDTLGFWNHTAPLMTPVVDNDPPEIVDNSPSSGYTGDAFTFEVNVTDNINSGNELTVKINWTHGSLGGNDTMSFIGGNTFQLTVTLDLYSVANMTYIIYAEDGAGNGNTTSPTGVIVLDNDAPAITDNSPEYAFWDEDFTFNASVIDNIAVSAVYVTYWIDSDASTNTSMSAAGGNFYEHTQTMPTSGTTLYYSFAAEDTAGNWAQSSTYNRTLLSGHVHNVDQGTWYDEIYEATDDANPGESIYVYPGTYHTHGGGTKDIVIDDDNVELIGRSSPDAIILVSQKDGITVTASNVLIKNITMVKDATAHPSNAFKKGIYLNGATNVTIENCNISEAGESAIYITGASSQINIINCTLYWNLQHGIYIGGDSSAVYVEGSDIYDNEQNGILIEDSNSNTVVNNNIYNNSDDGINIYRGLNNNVSWNNIYENENGITLEGTNQEDTMLNAIYHNTIHHNHIGIEFVIYAPQNNITYNTIHNNTQYGIEIPFTNNRENNNNNIHHNNFMDNTLGNAYDECNNDWDDGISEGNYWDDYDSNPPYEIPGGYNADNYPLVSPV